MQKNHTCKILAIGIIVLFIGVSFSSGFAVEHKLSVINIDNKDDCIECQSDSKIKILEKLINKIEKCEGLSYVINSMKLGDNRFICNLIEIRMSFFSNLSIYLYDKAESYSDGSFFNRLFELLFELNVYRWINMFWIGVFFGCWEDPY